MASKGVQIVTQWMRMVLARARERLGEGERAAALVEAIFTLPVLLTLLLGGFLLAYGLFAKIALTLAVGAQAREISKQHEYLAATAGVVNTLRGEAVKETYGLSRDNMRAIAMTVPGIPGVNNAPATVVAACYRLPWNVPGFEFFGVQDRGWQPNFTGPFADLEKKLWELEQKEKEISNRIDQGRYELEDVAALKNMILDATAKDQESQERGIRALVGLAMERAIGASCGGQGGLVLTSKAVVYSATTKHPR